MPPVQVVGFFLLFISQISIHTLTSNSIEIKSTSGCFRVWCSVVFHLIYQERVLEANDQIDVSSGENKIGRIHWTILDTENTEQLVTL